MIRPLLALLAALLFAPLASAVDESDLLPIDQAFVLEAGAPARDRIELRWTIAPGYYLYRHRMSARPVDAGIAAQPLALPEGIHKTDEFFGEVQTFRGEVTGTLSLQAPANGEAIDIEVRYQGCADVGVCYPPHRRTVRVALPGAASDGLPTLGDVGDPLGLANAGDALPPEQAFRIEAIVDGPNALLLRMTPAPGYYLYRDKTRFGLDSATRARLGAPEWPPARAHRDEYFGEVAAYFDQVEVRLPLQRRDADPLALALSVEFQGCQDGGLCYPPMQREFALALPAGGETSDFDDPAATDAAVAAAGDEADTLGLFAALFSALLGGLILNLFPCVLPVLSFKALALAQSGESRERARAHALWYTAGVLASFAAIGLMVISLRSAGNAMWGFQLQQPPVVATLTLLMLAIGLSLSGVVHFGAGLAGVGQHLAGKSGPAGDFFTGVLAVVVASPCTAPFMAGALGYAFVAPVLPALLVFLALGLGLALPFLLIGFVPALASRLPRPGPWMDALKSWLAFPMYLTAVWLAWVFGKQRGLDALALLLVAGVLLALGLWWFERQRYAERRLPRLVAWLILALAFATAWVALRVPAGTAAAQAADGVVAYSPERLAELRAEGRVVLVDMTADWCITCKVNESAVLHTERFRALLAETNAVYMVGDYTNVDPRITAFLERYRSPGVPLYVVLGPGDGPGEKLPQVLSFDTVEAAIRRAQAD
jgi:thiol:disulfide interchange protein DsbD